MAQGWRAIDVVIADAGTLSAAVDLKGFRVCGVYIPSTFEGTTLKFKASPTLAGTFLPVYNSSGEVSLTVAASRYVAIDPITLQGVNYLKAEAGTQTGAVTITLFGRSS